MAALKLDEQGESTGDGDQATVQLDVLDKIGEIFVMRGFYQEDGLGQQLAYRTSPTWFYQIVR